MSIQQGVFMFIKNTIKSVKSQENSKEFPSIVIPTDTDEDGTKIIESELSTLFISDEDPIMEEIEIEYNGEIVPVAKELVPKHKKYTLYISVFGHDNNQLHKIINALRKGTEHDLLEIRIDSPGGYVSEGIIMYNIMRELFNGRVTTYVDSTAFSMGAMLFSLGDERIAYEDSSLMYHNYSSGYFGKGQELKSYIDYEDRHFEEFFKKKIVSKGFLTDEEYQQMKIGQDFWLNSLDMAKRDICTHVIVGGFKLDNDAFIEYKNQTLAIDEWAMNKLSEQLAELAKEEEKKTTKKKTTKKKPTKKKQDTK